MPVVLVATGSVGGSGAGPAEQHLRAEGCDDAVGGAAEESHHPAAEVVAGGVEFRVGDVGDPCGGARSIASVWTVNEATCAATAATLP